MKGIVLAGGSGTRLYPLTLITSKQLLPVYDKPLVYYPLSTLMLAGIRDVLLVSTPQDLPNFRRLLGDGGELGMRLSYLEQPRPEGLAQAFVIAEGYLGGESCAMVLGDNIFYGNGLSLLLRRSAANAEQGGRATLLCYYVADPRRYGVAGFDEEGRVTSLEEKPEAPKSNYAVTGIYFFDGRAPGFAKGLKPSARGELEILDLAAAYMGRGELDVRLMGRGFAWLDAGTPDGLMDAGSFVQTMEKRQGIKVAAVEEIAFHNGWIGARDLLAAADRCGSSAYGAYLRDVAEGRMRNKPM